MKNNKKIIFDNSLITITEEYRERRCVYPRLFIKDLIDILKNNSKDHEEYEKRKSTIPDEIISSGEHTIIIHRKY